MKKKRDFQRWLISLQVLLTLFMLVLVGAGWSYAQTIQKIEASIAHYPAAFEARFHKKIGESYTPALHGSVMESAKSTEKGLVLLSSSARSFATWTFEIAGIGVMLCLFSIVLVARNLRNIEQ